MSASKANNPLLISLMNKHTTGKMGMFPWQHNTTANIQLIFSITNKQTWYSPLYWKPWTECCYFVFLIFVKEVRITHKLAVTTILLHVKIKCIITPHTLCMCEFNLINDLKYFSSHNLSWFVKHLWACMHICGTTVRVLSLSLFTQQPVHVGGWSVSI